ncbi:hypothetical protein VCR12J2_1020137 [Vibrio coralliirubri]|nr:hypothetical protein VCR6J2_370033 [Vibrio coralliirubri]CDT70710.1 hypothetical protein VCR15J2_470801 [Vibrio coralliirubri]CDT73093.1 hypothetical protein VCR26J2_350772 [Vibrio coralliirubri]CDT79504.1 hypothetical protein VCR12J2_1020137 [Vibrio coralliirubri]CDU11543.1 hypothetical protein VCR17J2_20272 [Vibrio coralliirubri]
MFGQISGLWTNDNKASNKGVPSIYKHQSNQLVELGLEYALSNLRIAKGFSPIWARQKTLKA